MKRKKCIICGHQTRDRNLEGKATTCDQRCAGILAWKTINGER